MFSFTFFLTHYYHIATKDHLYIHQLNPINHSNENTYVFELLVEEAKESWCKMFSTWKPFLHVFAIICGHVYRLYIHGIFGQDYPFKFQDGLGLFKEVNIWCYELLQRCPRILNMFFISFPHDFWCCMHAYLWYDFCLYKLLKIFHSFLLLILGFFCCIWKKDRIQNLFPCLCKFWTSNLEL